MGLQEKETYLQSAHLNPPTCLSVAPFPKPPRAHTEDYLLAIVFRHILSSQQGQELLVRLQGQPVGQQLPVSADYSWQTEK